VFKLKDVYYPTLKSHTEDRIIPVVTYNSIALPIHKNCYIQIHIIIENRKKQLRKEIKCALEGGGDIRNKKIQKSYK